MTHAATVLAMHSEMHTLFPNRPARWNWLETEGDVEKTITDHGADVDILLSASIEKLDRAMLARFPNLKMVASVSAGFSNVDLDECRVRGIAVTNAPGMNSGDVADLAVAMMTSLLLRIPQTQDYIMTDQWVSAAPPLRRSIRNMPVGIVGLGSIGREVVTRLTPFGVDLKWWGPRPKPNSGLQYYDDLRELASECRGLVICCRPDETTRHLINDKVLNRLGPDGVLVNVSRGSVVDEVALIEALRSHKIGGAGLDVFDPEPTNSIRWEGVPNLILTPHQGGATFETLFAQAQLAQSNVENFIDGKSLLSRVV